MSDPTTKTKDPQPTSAADWHRQGNALVDEGKLDRAITAFRRALRLDDSLAEVHNDLGAAYFQKHWYAEAEACFRSAIERDPRHAVAYANRGAALRELGRLNESRRAYQRALWLKVVGFVPRLWGRRLAAARPAQAAAAGVADKLHGQALAREAARKYDEALALVRQAIEARADRSEYHVTLARLLLQAGDFQRALDAATAALRLEPGSALVHATIAGIFHPWRDDLAEQAARHAIALDSQLAQAHANLAAALWGQGRLPEAEQAIRQAVALNPRSISHRASLALVLKDMERMDEARLLYRALVNEVPDDAKVCVDVASLAMESDGDLQTARQMYRKAQAAGDEPRAYMGEALVDLLEKRFESGWRNYEKRKRLLEQRTLHDQFAFLPDWDGTPLPEGRLLLYGEQGLGDEVMFASILPDLARLAPDVVILCDPRLAALLARSFPALQFIGEPRATQAARALGVPGVKAKLALGSLGAIFRRSERDFPRHGGYLVADPRKVQDWHARLPQGRTRKFGLSWKGGVQRTGRSRRSIALPLLEPLLNLPGIDWISLQHEDDSDDPRIRRFPGATQDLDDLAGLVGALDLVVSVCNTNVHVAGALGVPVLVMAPFVPEWRYGISGEAMVWYPAVRVFRQTRYGDWNEVLSRVVSACSSHAMPGGAAAST